MRSRQFVHVLVVALLFTGLNAIKPLHMDDSAFYTYAVEFAKHPGTPYAFITGSPYSMPANHLLAPPLLPSWWALGLTLLGDYEVLWKLWLFPFALLLAWGLWQLFRRVGPGVELPLLWLVMLSPGLLPSFNMMLEVPVLAFGVSALAVAMAASDRRSWGLAVLAGMLAGSAMQTKYTGIVTFGAMVVWWILSGAWRKGIVAVTVAVAVFVGWELWVVFPGGESHFLYHSRHRDTGDPRRLLQLVLPLWSLLGGIAPAAGLVGLTALGYSRARFWWITASVAAAFIAIALVPASWAVFVRNPETHKPVVTLSNVVYGWLGLLCWSTIVATAYALWKQRAEPRDATRDGLARRVDLFLVLWLMLEVIGYFMLSPFPAVRRVLGVFIASSVLIARLAARTCHTPERFRMISRAAAVGVTLGLFMFVVDWREARAAQQAVAAVNRAPWKPAAGGTTWFFDWWGFAYYAERAGLRPLSLDRSPPGAGDLLVVPEHLAQSPVLRAGGTLKLQLLDAVAITDWLPLKTVPGYYGGRTPLEHKEGPRLQVFIYRVSE
jgi:hypothetical protein